MGLKQDLKGFVRSVTDPSESEAFITSHEIGGENVQSRSGPNRFTSLADAAPSIYGFGRVQNQLWCFNYFGCC